MIDHLTNINWWSILWMNYENINRRLSAQIQRLVPPQLMNASWARLNLFSIVSVDGLIAFIIVGVDKVFDSSAHALTFPLSTTTSQKYSKDRNLLVVVDRMWAWALDCALGAISLSVDWPILSLYSLFLYLLASPDTEIKRPRAATKWLTVHPRLSHMSQEKTKR